MDDEIKVPCTSVFALVWFGILSGKVNCDENRALWTMKSRLPAFTETTCVFDLVLFGILSGKLDCSENISRELWMMRSRFPAFIGTISVFALVWYMV